VIEWFDDLTVGMRFKSPEKVVTREEIKRFASEFDPQLFHLDDAAAKQTPLKGLAASGWHIVAIAMRLALEVRPFGPEFAGAPLPAASGRRSSYRDHRQETGVAEATKRASSVVCCAKSGDRSGQVKR
jgi:hypothetical protein